MKKGFPYIYLTILVMIHVFQTEETSFARENSGNATRKNHGSHRYLQLSSTILVLLFSSHSSHPIKLWLSQTLSSPVPKLLLRTGHVRTN